MFAQRFLTDFRKSFGSASGREKRARVLKSDAVAEQVRKILQTVDQKLILMVRG